MQVLIFSRAPRTKETLPDFLKWCRVTRPPLVFRGLTGSQRTPGFWGVTHSGHFLGSSLGTGNALFSYFDQLSYFNHNFLISDPI